MQVGVGAPATYMEKNEWEKIILKNTYIEKISKNFNKAGKDMFQLLEEQLNDKLIPWILYLILIVL